MKYALKSLLLGVAAAFMLTGPALANDIEGRIESIDPVTQSFVVQGITFYTTPATDFDDGLKRFEDLQVGLKVEVDFVYRDGKHYATEIEKDD